MTAQTGLCRPLYTRDQVLTEYIDKASAYVCANQTDTLRYMYIACLNAFEQVEQDKLFLLLFVCIVALRLIQQCMSRVEMMQKFHR